ncbi:CsbD family protein [Pseudodesulfovibrio pelocollis]|uniref:CsbD family protein n=1 Tax=Pseudodesulfovibrio pelocollis TaxID=3051432 RepID=UPI00255B33F1|nr:CsbD family protein [Pseudodesulfovibrio sp. SB368]
MKASTKNQIKGKLHQASGKVKELVGKAIDNNEMQLKGKTEYTAGKIQEKTGEIEEVLEK